MRTPAEIAQSAKRILSDPGFVAAVEELDEALVHEWRTAATPAEREAAFFKQESLGMVVRQLETIINRAEAE